MNRTRCTLGLAAFGLAAIAGPVSAETLRAPLGIQGNSSAPSMVQAVESMYDPPGSANHGTGTFSVVGDSLAFNDGIMAKFAANVSTGNLLSFFAPSEVSHFVFPSGAGTTVVFTSLSGQANDTLGMRYLSPLLDDEGILGGGPPLLHIRWHDVSMHSNGLLSTDSRLADRLWQTDFAVTPSVNELVTYVLLRVGHTYRLQELALDVEVNTVTPPVTPPVMPNPPVNPDGPGTPIVPPPSSDQPPAGGTTPNVPSIVPVPQSVAMGLATLAIFGAAGMLRRRNRAA